MKGRLFIKLGILGVGAIFLFSMALYPTAQDVAAQAKGGNKAKPVDDFQDMPLCIDLFFGDLYPSNFPLCDATKGIAAFAGRRRSIALTLHQRLSDPYLALSLTPLDPIYGDPLPADDGGSFDNYYDPPVLGPDGRVYAPYFHVGISENVKDMDAETMMETSGRLMFNDANGTYYWLIWGEFPMAGGFQRTNPNAPNVHIQRNPDDGDGKRNWDVWTTGDEAAVEGRSGAHTAFLWGATGNNPLEYCGAFHVSFSFFAIQE